MLLTEKLEISLNNRYIKYWKDKGYDTNSKKIIVRVEDLPEQSHSYVIVKCDICKTVKKIQYYNYINSTKNGLYYCNKCKHIKTEKTNLEKYGVKSTLQSEDVLKQIKDINIQKHGVDHYSKSEEFKEKIKITCLENFGVDNYFNSKECKENKEKFLEKFGVDHYSKTDEFKEKTKNTCLDRFGVDSYSKTEEFKNNLSENIIRNYKEKYDLNITSYIGEIFNITCKEGHEYNIHKWLLKNRLHKYSTNPCVVCNPINSSSVSETEKKLVEFIKENYTDEIILNDRNIIGKELDIYLPDLNIAFEFNGLYWHDEMHKGNNYHRIKTDLCLEKGIKLYHIWEDDWNYKQEIVKSMILNSLGKSKNKIFARKCVIKDIKDNKLVRKFLDDNHIQGFINSSVKIGLFYEDELVSMMTFGKKRIIMNSNSSEGEYELHRFCNKLNTNVIGGASKIFNYFIKTYRPKEIITYADRSYSNGNLYKKLKFEFVKITQSNYYYIVDGIRMFRFGFRKDVLVKEGYDKELSEHQIMLNRNIYRIYDSGNLKFIWYPSKKP
jgi:hypothetical protein